MSKRFHIGALLSVTQDILLRPIGDVYRVIDYVTGQPHMTHQLIRAKDEITPHLVAQHPWLAGITVPEWVCDEPTVSDFLAEIATEHGRYHEVAPLSFGAYVGREPVAELEEMVGKDRVIRVEIPRSES